MSRIDEIKNDLLILIDAEKELKSGWSHDISYLLRIAEAANDLVRTLVALDECVAEPYDELFEDLRKVLEEGDE